MEGKGKLLLSVREAAEVLGISKSKLYALNANGQLGPQIKKIGRRSLLSRQELEAWVSSGMPCRDEWSKF